MTGANLATVVTQDVRFPTSANLDGSDAVNLDPDYSAAYVTLGLDTGEQGHGFVFTLGRGNEIVVAAIESYAELLRGIDLDSALSDLGEMSRRLVHDSQMRWLGPEKGVSHMACGALLNALWDVRAKRAGQPLWRLLCDLSADEIVDLIDFSHIRDALTPDEARDLLRGAEGGKQRRIEHLLDAGYPAYTTSPGWLGYSDEKLVRLSREAVADGFEMIKLKVGADVAEDRRRFGLVRSEFPDLRVSIDANQRWEVDEAIDWIRELAEFDPYWVEEPTSTDDILGHARIRTAVMPCRIATGEAVANRIVFKQMLQQGSLDFLQLDATRVGGINENIATMLLARKFSVPVCPHAGGVGLSELVQHYAFFDYAAISEDQSGRYIEYVDHLHEHFVEPVRVVDGRYLAPQQPGTGAEMHEKSRDEWSFPEGPGWRSVG